MLPEFDLLMPRTLPEALHLLSESAPDVLPLAGGTNLVPDLRGGNCKPDTLVGVGGLDALRGIRRESDQIVVGSGVTIAELLESEVIIKHGGVLRQAAEVFANPLVRNRATIGGNLGNASPAADAAPPLLVLDAEIELASNMGSRWVPLRDFFVHVCDTVCEPMELITAVRWPVPTSRTFGGFRKLSLRKSTAVSVVSVAVQVTFDGEGRCENARIALGAVAPTPIRAYQAEEILHSKALTPEVIDEATRLACGAARCIGDVRSSAAYRERVIDVLMRRLLEEVGSQV
jgi:carbon-monoxide dehydrogenase medium subunit